MQVDNALQQRLVRIGAAAGLIGCLMYGVRSFPIPDLLGRVLFIFFGPVLVVAYVGVFPFMARPRPTIAAVLGSVFGIIGAAVNMAFASVQLNTLHYLRGSIRAAASEAERQQWRHILQGVFTVQNGLNYVADFFFDWTIFFWAVLMWRHPRFGGFFARSRSSSRVDCISA